MRLLATTIAIVALALTFPVGAGAACSCAPSHRHLVRYCKQTRPVHWQPCVREYERAIWG